MEQVQMWREEAQRYKYKQPFVYFPRELKKPRMQRPRPADKDFCQASEDAYLAGKLLKRYPWSADLRRIEREAFDYLSGHEDDEDEGVR
jgi:hypothetical protein